MKVHKICWFWAALHLVSLAANAQSDSSGLQFGIFGGYYMPGDAPAQYYSGLDNNRLGFILNNPQIRPQIEAALGNYSYTLESHASDMAYQNTFSFELAATYIFSSQWYISVRLYNARLVASGIFTLDVDRTNQGGGPPNNLEQVSISGAETRSHIDLGLGKRILIGNNLFVLGEVGFDLNFNEVTENEFNVAGRTFALPIFSDPLNPQASPGNTVGTGFYALSGIGYDLPSSYGFWLKLCYQQTRININRVIEENSAILIPSLGFTKRL